MSAGQLDMFGTPPSPSSTPARAKERAPGHYKAKRMMQTREQLIGVSGKTLAARTMRTVASVRAQVAGLGAAFEDVDNSVVGAADELMRHFDDFERAVREAVDYLKEAPEEA